MERFFNTEGPIKEEKHYCIDPLSRIDINDIFFLIHREKYFVLHAPRQTGKTSYLFALMKTINTGGKYQCLYINVEPAQAARENVKAGMRTILNILANKAVDYLNDSFIKETWQEIFEESGEFSALQDVLKLWAKNSSKPLVLFIDEIDSLVGDTLISVLRQLRSGYTDRPALFPQSIILCGVRDVRDYRLYSERRLPVDF
jgi:hypothetical protein